MWENTRTGSYKDERTIAAARRLNDAGKFAQNVGNEFDFSGKPQ